MEREGRRRSAVEERSGQPSCQRSPARIGRECSGSAVARPVASSSSCIIIIIIIIIMIIIISAHLLVRRRLELDVGAARAQHERRAAPADLAEVFLIVVGESCGHARLRRRPPPMRVLRRQLPRALDRCLATSPRAAMPRGGRPAALASAPLVAALGLRRFVVRVRGVAAGERRDCNLPRARGGARLALALSEDEGEGERRARGEGGGREGRRGAAAAHTCPCVPSAPPSRAASSCLRRRRAPVGSAGSLLCGEAPEAAAPEDEAPALLAGRGSGKGTCMQERAGKGDSRGEGGGRSSDLLLHWKD